MSRRMSDSLAHPDWDALTDQPDRDDTDWPRARLGWTLNTAGAIRPSSPRIVPPNARPIPGRRSASTRAAAPERRVP